MTEDVARPICASDEAGSELADVDALGRGLRSGRLIELRGRRHRVLLGDGSLVKVNTSIGCTDPRESAIEIEKLEELAAVPYRPDLMMDLSIVRLDRPLYAAIVERFGGPVGTLPHYLCYSTTHGIDRSALLEELAAQAEAGVAWMTLHVAVTRELWRTACQTRGTPVTARGGGMVIADMERRGEATGVFDTLFPEVLSILRRHRTALSLGTTFRPAAVSDALDEAHRGELRLQGQYIDEARRQGIPVLLEAVGHMTLGKAAEFTRTVRQELGYDLPIMTLGPTSTDAAVGEDHVASAIGGAFLAMHGGTNVLNSVTREEHTGGVPERRSIIEGLRAARVAAHAVNISLFGEDAVNRSIVAARAQGHTCVIQGGLFGPREPVSAGMGCTRCRQTCPLRVNHALAPTAVADKPERAPVSADAAPAPPRLHGMERHHRGKRSGALGQPAVDAVCNSLSQGVT